MIRITLALAATVAIGLAACTPAQVARFDERAGPAIAQACAAFHKAEASPLVQLAVAGGSIANPAVGAALGWVKASGSRFCAEGPPAGDTTTTAERVAWLAGVTEGMVRAATR